MPHPNASKGARWERFCAGVLAISRTLAKGKHDDAGDLLDTDFIYECKDDGSRSPMQWWEQAEAARRQHGKPWAVVLSKARLPKPGQPKGWAQMDIAQWRDLREYVRALEDFAFDRGGLESLRRGRGARIHEGLEDYPVSLSLRFAPYRPHQP